MSKTLKTVNNYFTLAGSALTNAMEERLRVSREGRTKQWEKEQYSVIGNKFSKEADKITNSMLEAAKAERDKYVMEARILRNRPSSPLKPKDGNMMVYHQNRIMNALFGLSEEDSIKEYSLMARQLNDDEKQYLHIYEDALMAKMKDVAYKQAAKDEIFMHKSAKEKTAYVNAEQAEAEVKEIETLAAIMKNDIEKVANGDKVPAYSYHDIFEEIGRYEKVPTLVKINPHAKDDGDSGEAE